MQFQPEDSHWPRHHMETSEPVCNQVSRETLSFIVVAVDIKIFALVKTGSINPSTERETHCPNLPRDFFHENQKLIFKQSSTTQQQRKVFVAQLVRALVSYSYMRWLLTITLAIQRSRVRVSPRTICFCF